MGTSLRVDGISIEVPVPGLRFQSALPLQTIARELEALLKGRQHLSGHRRCPRVPVPIQLVDNDNEAGHAPLSVANMALGTIKRVHSHAVTSPAVRRP